MNLVTIGHIVYDIRCYVNEFPKPNKTSFMKSTISYSGGGSAANVAVCAAKLGMRAGVIGNIGNDRHGEALLRYLKEAKVDVAEVRIKRGQSGIAIVIIDKDAEVEIVEALGVNEPFGRIEQMTKEYIERARWLHMTGTDLQVLERASNIAKKSGVPVSFDPGRSKSMEGMEKLGRIIGNCNYLIVNKHEILAITGMKNVKNACERVIEMCEATCIIKNGGDPVYVSTQYENFEVPTFHVQPVDTIGAGDAFSAGFITALHEGKKLKAAVKFANAVAAAKVLRKGAQSLPSRKKIEAMFRV